MLKGKTALVTGSTSGIGLGMAVPWPAGANASCSTASATWTQPGPGASQFDPDVGYHGADMSKPDRDRGHGARLRGRDRRVDILVNNAGIQHVAAVEDFPVDRWDAIIAINLSSAFHTTRLALPGMKRRNWGRMINVASVHGLVASAKSAYVAPSTASWASPRRWRWNAPPPASPSTPSARAGC
jgi:3-hydroxybutyrate dehydrogenase